MRLRLSIPFVLVGLWCLEAHAQDSLNAPEFSRSSFGIGAVINRDFLTSSFYGVPGCPQCSPLITSGTGIGNALEGYYAYHLDNAFTLSLGIGYQLVNASMSQNELTWINIDAVATPATINHTIDVSLNRLALSPSIGYEVIPQLSINLGTQVGYLLSPTFSSQERLVQPSDRGAFENGLRTRDEYSGSLPNPNKMQAALTVGVRYSLPMNAQKTLSLVPSVGSGFGLLNLIRGVNWRENNIGASLAVEYRPMVTPKPQPIPKLHPDTIQLPPKAPAIYAAITASGVDSSGAEEGRVALRIEEFYETALVPLVPYVFFEAGSSTLADRYHKLAHENTSQFSESKLPGNDRLALYRELLNTIGKRLTEHLSARVTLVACADPSMAPTDASDLAESRAKTIKNYLSSTWAVDPSRITIRARTLPEHPSPVTDTDGITEDRRVEIASNDPAILAPVFISDTLRTASPPTIRFHPKAEAERGFASWTVTAAQNGATLKTFEGIGNPPETLDWIVANDQTHVPRAPGILDYKLHVEDFLGQQRDATSHLPVEQVTLRNKRREVVQTPNGRAEIERYSLILFDFNSSELTTDPSGQNERTIALIKNRITNRSQVSVRGFTDRIGDSEYNRRLADERALRTSKALGLSQGVVMPADTRQVPYDNDLPEGRFYSRTVEITIRIPLEGSN